MWVPVPVPIPDFRDRDCGIPGLCLGCRPLLRTTFSNSPLIDEFSFEAKEESGIHKKHENKMSQSLYPSYIYQVPSTNIILKIKNTKSTFLFLTNFFIGLIRTFKRASSSSVNKTLFFLISALVLMQGWSNGLCREVSIHCKKTSSSLHLTARGKSIHVGNLPISSRIWLWYIIWLCKNQKQNFVRFKKNLYKPNGT